MQPPEIVEDEDRVDEMWLPDFSMDSSKLYLPEHRLGYAAILNAIYESGLLQHEESLQIGRKHRVVKLNKTLAVQACYWLLSDDTSKLTLCWWMEILGFDTFNLPLIRKLANIRLKELTTK